MFVNAWQRKNHADQVQRMPRLNDRLNTMNPLEELTLTVAGIVREAAAMGDAALAGDFDEARFRANLIIGTADAAGLTDIVLAAGRALDQLGSYGERPKLGYGAAILSLADSLEAIGFERL